MELGVGIKQPEVLDNGTVNGGVWRFFYLFFCLFYLFMHIMYVSFVSVFDSGFSCLSVLHHSERMELWYNNEHSSQHRRPSYFWAHIAHVAQAVSSLDHWLDHGSQSNDWTTCADQELKVRSDVETCLTNSWCRELRHASPHTGDL